MIEFIQSLLAIDKTLLIWIQDWGNWIYLILFLIVFCETGLVFVPFLPGDSLLFAAGILAGGKYLNIEWIIPLLIAAAVIGDSLNYFVGKKFGRKLFEADTFFLRKSYLKHTEEFFEKKGVWAVSLSRFFPIIRTVSPFFAGMSLIPYKRFVTLSFFGSVAWVFIFVLVGYYFGQLEFIQKNFTNLIMAIIAFSLLPIVWSTLKAFRQARIAKKA